MKTISKKLIIASVCLIVGGGVIAGAGIMLGGWPGLYITKAGIGSYSGNDDATLEKTRLDSFSKAAIEVKSSADIQVLPSDDDNYYLEYVLDASHGALEYQVTDGELSLYQPGGVTIGIFFTYTLPNTYVNLYVPKDEVLDLMTIDNDSGDVTIKGTQFKDADITVDYGDVLLDETSFKSLNLTLNSSDFELDHSEIGTFTLINEYGKNTLKNFKCDTADIKTDSGSLDMDALEINKLFCDSEYGDITLLLPGELENYSFYVTTEYGDIDIPEGAPRGFYSNENDDECYKTEGTDGKLIEISADSGDIEIRER